jgi:hypothetical protein
VFRGRNAREPFVTNGLGKAGNDDRRILRSFLAATNMAKNAPTATPRSRRAGNNATRRERVTRACRNAVPRRVTTTQASKARPISAVTAYSSATVPAFSLSEQRRPRKASRKFIGPGTSPSLKKQAAPHEQAARD